MKILVMGGTGVIGQELIPQLALDVDNELVVTSRKQRVSQDRVNYIRGNAKEISFIKPLIEGGDFDVIIDFMLYSVGEFEARFELMMKSCRQYIFFSSSRVYAASEKPVNEASDRLLDVSKDRKFLEEGEYSLTKAKEEDILKNSNYKNWVIIRPYKTYNDSRLQLGVLELEQWFYRAVSGKTVVVPGNIKNLHTSLTNSKDTAQILKRIIGNSIFNGQIFQIANPQKVTWGDVIQIYSQCIEEYNGRKMKICYAKDTSDIEIAFNNKYRIKYDGLVDRTFDDSSVTFLMKGTNFSWTPLDVGLTRCVRSALMQSNRMVQNYSIEGLYDRMTGEFTCLLKIPGVKNRFKYLLHRIFRENTIKRIKYFIHR